MKPAGKMTYQIWCELHPWNVVLKECLPEIFRCKCDCKVHVEALVYDQWRVQRNKTFLVSHLHELLDQVHCVISSNESSLESFNRVLSTQVEVVQIRQELVCC
jgi:hypothetical protein